MDQENSILKSDSGQFLLTDRKVRFTIKNWGRLNVKSIMLNKISSVEISFKSSYLLLVIAVLSVVLGYFSGNENGNTFGIIFGFLFVIFYFMTLKRVMVISSPSTSISISVKKIGNKEAVEFMDQLEEQIHSYKKH